MLKITSDGAYPFNSYAHPPLAVAPDCSSLRTPLRNAKYLGSGTLLLLPGQFRMFFFDLLRCAQAFSACKKMPFSFHTLISAQCKLQVYSQIVQAILLHGSESQIDSPS